MRHIFDHDRVYQRSEPRFDQSRGLRLQFFESSALDPRGHGEGEFFWNEGTV